jgi:lipoprotein-releasing system ATP-binding protein
VSLLDVLSLTKIYPSGSESIQVLGRHHLSVEEGETVVITGESGCGKSTFLNLVGGLDSATSGSIRFDGLRPDRQPEHVLARVRTLAIGFIFQLHYLLRDFTALENVLLPALIDGVHPREARSRAEGLLARVDLSKRAGHYPSELSGGERQRVAVARALINRPRLILADEPTGNLDERNSAQVRDLLFGLVEELGRTLVLVTHDPDIAGRARTRYHLEHGVLQAR